MSRICLSLLLLALGQCAQISICASATPDAAAKSIREDAGVFVQQTELLERTAKDFHAHRRGKTALREQLKKTRLAYKRVEFMLEYYYPEHIKAYINGPPLRHLDPYPYQEIPLPDAYYSDSSYINIAPLDYQEPNAHLQPREVVEPQGLQTLDEIIFSEEVSDDADKILSLTGELVKRSKIVVQALLKRRYIEEYQIIEAARLEMVRIFTLGLTGFDTPGSLNAIDEAEAAISALAGAIESTIGNAKLFSSALALLKGQNFDELDRLRFLRLAVNPIYDALQQTHQKLKLTYSRDLTHETQSWNVESRNIFSDDFLNPYSYTLLKEHQDSEALRRLGRRMFYDNQLGGNGSMSCSSCHKPEHAFADGLTKSSIRNTPSIINAVFSDRFFYDMRALSLEQQITDVVENPLELNTSLNIIADKVNGADDYTALIAEAFNGATKPVNRYQVLSALSSYVASLRSFNSSFDRYVRGETRRIDPAVADGFNLFMGKAACGACHYAPTFSGLIPPLYRENESEVLGVLRAPDVRELDPDQGRSHNRHFQEDAQIFERSFKTVTVRNIELTAPYFHNGAYQTLDEVIDFYDKGGAQGMGLRELPNQTLPPEPLHLTVKEKAALKAFLLSLTDHCAIQKFSAEPATKAAPPALCNTITTMP